MSCPAKDKISYFYFVSNPSFTGSWQEGRVLRRATCRVSRQLSISLILRNGVVECNGIIAAEVTANP